jgi:hypothetical protein
MPTIVSPPPPTIALTLSAALCVMLSACAQTAPQSAGSASAVIRDAQARAAAYTGHFESGCQQLGDAFYTKDLVDLTPAGPGIDARYGKAIHDAEGCEPSSLVVIFHLPTVQWVFDGTTQFQGRTVDRIQTMPTGNGQLTASRARAGWLSETPTQFVLHRNGGGKGLPVDKAVEQTPTKELRYLDGDRLYTSALDGDPMVYPTALSPDDYLERKPSR